MYDIQTKCNCNILQDDTLVRHLKPIWLKCIQLNIVYLYFAIKSNIFIDRLAPIILTKET